MSNGTCKKYEKQWKENMQDDIHTSSGRMINFVRCSKHGIDKNTGFKYVLLQPGLYLYHGSKPIAKSIIEDHVDPIYPLGKDSNLEESWYGSYSTAFLYAENPNLILVYKVHRDAKMFLLNDLDNIILLLENIDNIFPKRLTAEQKEIKQQFTKFLHYFIWIQTGEGGKYIDDNRRYIVEQNFQQTKLEKPKEIKRHDSSILEQRMAKFLCGWLKKYGFAGYISDIVRTTDYSYRGTGREGAFHAETVFCYAPDYLTRELKNKYDAQERNVGLDLMQLEFQAKKKDYIDFVNSINKNPKIDEATKEKWKFLIAGLKMPKVMLKKHGMRYYTQLCDINGKLVDIYSYITKNNQAIRKLVKDFPTVTQIKQQLRDTDNVIGTLKQYCNFLKKHNLDEKLAKGYLPQPMDVEETW